MVERHVPDEWLEVPDSVPSWLRRRLPDLDDERGRRQAMLVIVAVLVVGLLAVSGRGGSRPADPVLDASTAASTIPGFEQMAFRISPSPANPAAAAVADALRCALLADTPEQWQQGLQGIADLGSYDGMLFRFDDDVTYAFHTRNTPLPISIAFFDARGRYVSAVDTEPCPEGADCPTYRAAGAYRYALEVRQGTLNEMGATSQSAIVIGGACPSTAA